MNGFFAERSNFISACGGGSVGYCVAVAIDKKDGMVGVRDTKDDSRKVLTFDTDEWKHFVSAVKDGKYDVE